MTRRDSMRVMMGGVAVSLLGGCGQMFPERYRFRMTVVVETPQGVRTGSSVYEVTAYNTSEFLPDAHKRDWYVRGEAVAVDLPGGQTLFALMRPKSGWDSLAQVSMDALDPAFKNDIVESAARISEGRNVRRAGRVKPENYPMLVHFRDIRDAKTIDEVDPDDLTASFGSGVGLQSITIYMTASNITKTVDEIVPNLGTASDFLQWRQHLPNDDFRSHITRNDFIQR